MFFVVLFYLLPGTVNAQAMIKKSPGNIITDITYTDENAKQYQFDASKQRLTALHFWATWCVPCVKELPQVNEAQKKYANKGFKVIALSLDGNNIENVKIFYKDNKIEDLDLSFDPEMKEFQKFKIRGLPTTIFINEKGKEVARAEGELDWRSGEVEDFISLFVKDASLSE